MQTFCHEPYSHVSLDCNAFIVPFKNFIYNFLHIIALTILITFKSEVAPGVLTPAKCNEKNR